MADEWTKDEMVRLFEASRPARRMQFVIEQIDSILESLREEERWIIDRRFLGIPRTQEQVAAGMGISRQRVSQIEQRAFRKLCHPSRSRRLKEYRAWAQSPGDTTLDDFLVARLEAMTPEVMQDRLRELLTEGAAVLNAVTARQLEPSDA